MLELNPKNLDKNIDLSSYQSVLKVSNKKYYEQFNLILKATFIVILTFAFLPWTQNIQGNGFVTTLSPEQRPQTIHSVIGGRIEKWYVNEGDFVNQGDTIIFISETNTSFLDPNLLSRTQAQLNSKKLSSQSYDEKVKALENQYEALQVELKLKLEQAQNYWQQARLKVISDSMNLEAAKTQMIIAQKQFDRFDTLYKTGLKSLTDLEQRKMKLQESNADLISKENLWLASKNEWINAQIELGRIEAQYADKIAKVKSEKFSTLSGKFETDAEINKLENQFSNYEVRSGMYYIKAPQSGYINRALQSGIGETIKEGTPIVSIMPDSYSLAVETFVAPIDLPLVRLGEKVRIFFDGWPAVVFSGWENMSYGTYGGKIVAIENFISQKGKYRVLIAPDNDGKKWPDAVRVGSGAQTIIMLKDVPIWFEMWRKINGFPPNYYQPDTAQNNEK